tara:strand:- start:4977 stop:5198 length:222 start_codon:yes stop_codon:yes gene_type:complete
MSQNKVLDYLSDVQQVFENAASTIESEIMEMDDGEYRGVKESKRITRIAVENTMKQLTEELKGVFQSIFKKEN